MLPSQCLAPAPAPPPAIQMTRLNVRETARKYDELVAHRAAAPTPTPALSTSALEFKVETHARHHVRDVRSLFEGRQGPLNVRQAAAAASADDAPRAARVGRRFDVYGRVLIQQPGAIVRSDSTSSPDGGAATEVVAGAAAVADAVESCVDTNAADSERSDSVSTAMDVSPIAVVHQHDGCKVTTEVKAGARSTYELSVDAVMVTDRNILAVTDDFAASREAELELDFMDSSLLAAASISVPVEAASPAPAEGLAAIAVAVAATAFEPAPAPAATSVPVPVPVQSVTPTPALALVSGSTLASASSSAAALAQAQAPAPVSAEEDSFKRVAAFVTIALLCLSFGFAVMLPTSADKCVSYVAIQGLVAVMTMSFGLFSEWMYWLVPVLMWIVFSVVQFVLKTTCWIGFVVLLQLSTTVCYCARWSFAFACAVGRFEHAKEMKPFEDSNTKSDSEAVCAFKIRYACQDEHAFDYDYADEPEYERGYDEPVIEPALVPAPEQEEEEEHRVRLEYEHDSVFDHDFDHDLPPFDSMPAANVVPEAQVVVTEMHSDALSPTGDHHEALGQICPTDTDGRSALEDMRDELVASVSDVSVVQVVVPVVNMAEVTPVVTAEPVTAVAQLTSQSVVPSASVLVAVSVDEGIPAAVGLGGVSPVQSPAVAPVVPATLVASEDEEIPVAVGADAVSLVQSPAVAPVRAAVMGAPVDLENPAAMVVDAVSLIQSLVVAPQATSTELVAPVPAPASRAVGGAVRPRRSVSHGLPYNRNVASRYLNYKSDSLAYERNLSGAAVVRAAVAARQQS